MKDINAKMFVQILRDCFEIIFKIYCNPLALNYGIRIEKIQAKGQLLKGQL